ncbi:hypothetical protein KRE47_14820 [Elizabethkingia meningoseptica]|uniref:hypothetical protein n=1 Tax=Elizabethkingia meningoseptica TaxID=238 RepID=UPI0022F1B6D3|nr:hypothetical protein [Elizabethkingia meningoseptica]EJK5328379.1 hypothetical protein [Elizabethkingia meningoseptica]MDE5468170.1 hypothetical protein [Elizabethkingia meningoseptica]MDE5475776.1 hypothetical protein [Elizabethkingia meningoseptica]MDE5479653.1 hypothetical protein [Elizabethkingia meningoseptica]MDE5485371.1 hypothetical protein [Elizabethkingia meningoseptica]
MIKKLLFLFLIFFITWSCKEGEKTHPYTFYYWRTKLELNAAEKKNLQQATVPVLHTRYFDIDKSAGRFQPVGVLTSTEKVSQKIVPVVFIMNRVWENITPEELNFLAEKTNELIKKITAENTFNTTNEIQIDSDWTAGTRDDYFAFLKKLKQVSGKEITCTIRLHQVKDKKNTGIPPVNKGYLMCYATSSPLEDTPQNSILDVTTLKNYLSGIDQYSLKLDIALPIYSWGIVTNHLGRHKLINALTDEELIKDPKFKKINDHTYEVLEDHFYEGFYLSKGFRIKVEEISQQDLNLVKNFLNKKLKNYTIIYYHLDSRFLHYQY